ncbi:MAG: SMI1/KNR4 family protein [Pseudomonadota bacterium]
MSSLIDPIAGTLRILIGLAVVGIAGYTGFSHSSPWIVLIYAPVFTVLYALGKWRAWRVLLRERGPLDIVKAIAATLPIQAVVFGVCYLVGLGLGRLLAPDEIAPGITPADWWLAAQLLFGAGAATAVIIAREHDKPDPLAEHLEALSALAKHADPEKPGYGIPDEDEMSTPLDPAPLTEETFFIAPHYSHKTPGDTDDGEALPRAARTTPEMIAEAEARLGVVFPDLLRRLYARQNGGYVGWLFVPATETPRPVDEDWRGAFAIDYSDLVPLERLRTLKDSYLDFTDPDDDEAMTRIPGNADRMIVLAQRYMDTTYLDYSRPGPPRVGLVDFDGGSEPDVFFDDFETFFAALRREAGED